MCVNLSGAELEAMLAFERSRPQARTVRQSSFEAVLAEVLAELNKIIFAEIEQEILDEISQLKAPVYFAVDYAVDADKNGEQQVEVIDELKARRERREFEQFQDRLARNWKSHHEPQAA